MLLAFLIALRFLVATDSITSSITSSITDRIKDGIVLFSKTYSQALPIVNQPFHLYYRIYNMSPSQSLSDLQIVDTTYSDPKVFMQLDHIGEPVQLTGESESVPVWETSIRVVGLQAGPLLDQAATLQYSVSGEERTVLSSHLGSIHILTENEYLTRFANHSLQWSIFYLLASLPCVISAYLYLKQRPQFYY